MNSKLSFILCCDWSVHRHWAVSHTRKVWNVLTQCIARLDFSPICRKVWTFLKFQVSCKPNFGGNAPWRVKIEVCLWNNEHEKGHKIAWPQNYFIQHFFLFAFSEKDQSWDLMRHVCTMFETHCLEIKCTRIDFVVRIHKVKPCFEIESSFWRHLLIHVPHSLHILSLEQVKAGVPHLR